MKTAVQRFEEADKAWNTGEDPKRFFGDNDKDNVDTALAIASAAVDEMRAEMRRLVDLLDGECMLPDGSNADTSKAHALLGDFAGDP